MSFSFNYLILLELNIRKTITSIQIDHVICVFYI